MNYPIVTAHSKVFWDVSSWIQTASKYVLPVAAIRTHSFLRRCTSRSCSAEISRLDEETWPGTVATVSPIPTGTFLVGVGHVQRLRFWSILPMQIDLWILNGKIPVVTCYKSGDFWEYSKPMVLFIHDPRPFGAFQSMGEFQLSSIFITKNPWHKPAMSGSPHGTPPMALVETCRNRPLLQAERPVVTWSDDFDTVPKPRS